MQGSARTAAAPAPTSPLVRRGARKLGRTAFYATVTAALCAGWLARDDGLVAAEYGLGYALGIAGATMMLLLLLYPVRKHARFMRRLGAVKHWFRAHMILGVLGPVLILFHANFQAGSLNSTVALFCMLLVASSGFVGRYFYRKIHHGLYGEKVSLTQLSARADALRSREVTHSALPDDLMEQLRAFDRTINQPAANPLSALLRPLALTLRSRVAERRLHRRIRASLAQAAAASPTVAAQRRRLERAATGYVSEYLAVVRRVAELRVFERLFSLWHVFHLPFFFMLVVAAIVHVLAVHMY